VHVLHERRHDLAQARIARLGEGGDDLGGELFLVVVGHGESPSARADR